MAAAVVEDAAIGQVRDALGALAIKGVPFHWHDESEERKALGIETLAQLPALHIVVIGTPMRESQQERARKICLETLFPLLDGAGVQRFVMDSRQERGDARDLQMVRNCQRKRLIGRDLRLSFDKSRTEATLIAADIAAGAVGESLEGDSPHVGAIAHLLDVHTIAIS